MGEACLVDKHNAPLIQTGELDPSESCGAGTWYALRVRCGGEAFVVKGLKSRGLHPYCPTYPERRRYSDRMKVVDRPLFPGYVLCQFNLELKLPVVSCPGVDYIVGFAGLASVIPQGQIDSVRRMVQAGAVTSEPSAIGDRVRVTHGPLLGIEGLLVRTPGGDRLIVAIDLLQQAASLTISKDHTTTIKPESRSGFVAA